MAEFSRLSDAELWKQLADEGSEDAFRALMERHGALVWGVCSRILRGDDADDAFQMAFLALLEHGGGIRSPDFGPWLYRVAYRAVLRVRAARGPLEQANDVHSVAEPTSDVFQAIEEAERSQLIAEAIDGLPDQYREVIVLHYGRGLKRAEIARQLNLTDVAVKSRLARGRGVLRSRLLRRGVSLSMAGLFFDSLVEGARASTPPVAETWELVQRTLAGEPVSLAKAQFSDLPEMECGMNYVRGLKAKWAIGAAVAAAALFLTFEAGRSSGSRGQAAGDDSTARRSVIRPPADSPPADLEPVISEFRPIRLASATGIEAGEVHIDDDLPVHAASVPGTDPVDVTVTGNPVASLAVADAPARSHGLPDGRWSRESAIGTAVFEINGARLRVDFEGNGELAWLKASLRGEYATASDGAIFGIIHRVDVDFPPSMIAESDLTELMPLLTTLNDLPFTMRVYSEPDAMLVKSMTVGVPTSFAEAEMAGLGVYAMFLSGIYTSEDQ